MGVCQSAHKPSFYYAHEHKKKEKKSTIEFSTPEKNNKNHLEKRSNLYKKGVRHNRTISSESCHIVFDDKIESDGEEIKSPKKYKRKDKRSISLSQKVKIKNKLFEEELKLKVTTNALIEENTGLPNLKYQIIRKIGEGSYGSVFLAINSLTKQNVAIKKINKIKENEIDELEIKNEIDILRNLDHPNIVKIIEFYTTEKAYYLITDYCPSGELYNQITNSYNEYQLAVLFYQIFSGLYYLHTNNIIHRDLKLENILINEIEKDNKTNLKYFWIKIIDFGTSKIFSKHKKEKSIVGSSYYIAPEVLNQSYNEKCDTWSVGVILYMLISGKAPFDGKDDFEIIENIKKGIYDDENKRLLNSSEEVQDLVHKLLEINIKKRLSAHEALQHPWFYKFNGKSLYSNISIDEIKQYLDRLRKFQIHSKFEQMVLAFIVHNINDNDEIKDILKIFRLFNTNDDGKLTKNELYHGLIKYYNEEDIRKEINDIYFMLDGADRGFLEFEEFLRACLDKKKLLSDENLLYAFNFFDKDFTGKISVDKIKATFVENSVKNEVFENILNEIDHNQDGEIDFKDFKNMMLGG